MHFLGDKGSLQDVFWIKKDFVCSILHSHSDAHKNLYILNKIRCASCCLLSVFYETMMVLFNKSMGDATSRRCFWEQVQQRDLPKMCDSGQENDGLHPLRAGRKLIQRNRETAHTFLTENYLLFFFIDSAWFGNIVYIVWIVRRSL